MSTYQDLLNRIMKGDYSEVSASEKQTDIDELKKVCAVASAAVSFQPIPLLDTAMISPIQIAMVQGIARVHGYKLDQRAILEMLSTFGASLVAQNVIMAAAKLIPVAGWLVSVSMAYALTYAIAEVSDHYFATGRGADSAELKEMFKKVYKAKKDEKQRAHKGNASLAQRLEQLKKARQDGLINDAEFAAKKEEMLSSF